jgi:hypothetical protein
MPSNSKRKEVGLFSRFSQSLGSTKPAQDDNKNIRRKVGDNKIITMATLFLLMLFTRSICSILR